MVLEQEPLLHKFVNLVLINRKVIQMLSDNVSRIGLGAIAAGAILLPILLLASGNNWNDLMAVIDKYADAQNVAR